MSDLFVHLKKMVPICLIGMNIAACDKLRSVDQISSRGQSQYEKSNYQAALTDFKAVLQKDAANVVAQTYLARIYFHMGNFEAAEEALNSAFPAGVKDQDLSVLKYKILLSRRKYDEILAQLVADNSISEDTKLLFSGLAKMEAGKAEAALNEFNQGLQVKPDDLELMIGRARVFIASSDFIAATKDLELVLDRYPENAHAHYLMGLLQVSKGDLAAASASLKTADKSANRQMNWYEQSQLYALLTDVSLRMNRADDVKAWLARIESRAPNSPIVYYFRARSLLLQGNTSDALIELQKATNASTYLPARLLLANVLMAQSSYEQAEEKLNKLHSDFPENLEVQKLLAQLYLMTGRSNLASKILPPENKTLGLVDPQLDWLRGQTLFASGSSDAGIKLLEKSVLARPDDWSHRLQLVRAYILDGRRQSAIELLNSLPDSLGAKRTNLLVLASVLGKSKKDADQEIDNLLAKNSQDASLHAAAGNLVLRAGDVNRAQSLLNKAVLIDSANTEARLGLVSVFIQQKKYLDAESQLREILSYDKKNTQASISLAALAMIKNDKPAAKKQLELTVGNDPSVVEPRLLLARLAISDKDYDAAKKYLDQAVNVSESDPRVVYAAGSLLLGAKQYGDALPLLERAASSGVKMARIEAAQANLGLGQKVQAKQKLELAATDSETQLLAVQLLVQQDVEAGKLHDALERLNVLKLSGASVATIEEMTGDAYYLAKVLDKASAHYDLAAKNAISQKLAIKQFKNRLMNKSNDPTIPLVKWLEKTPRDSGVIKLLASYCMDAGRDAEALSYYEKFMDSTEQRDAEVLNNLAWLNLSKNPLKAENLAQESYQLASNKPEIMDTYGWVLYKNKKKVESLTVLRKAAGMAPMNLEIQYHLAQVLVEVGQKDEAKKILGSIIGGTAQFASIQEAKSLLKKLGG